MSRSGLGAEVKVPIRQPYDNNLTYAYKVAIAYQIPVFLIYQDRPISNWLAQKDVNLPQLSRTLLQQSTRLTPRDLAMIYYATNRNNLLPPALMQAINTIYDTIPSPYPTEADLIADYPVWRREMEQIVLLEDEPRLQTIETQQAFLDSIPEPYPVVKDRVELLGVYRYQPRLSLGPDLKSGNAEITAINGAEIFSRARVSPQLPYIQYNDSAGNKSYKLYAPPMNLNLERDTSPLTSERTNQNALDYTKIIYPANRAIDRDTLYLRVWVGDLSKTTLQESAKYLFVSVAIELKPDTTIDLKNPIIKSIITEHLPLVLTNEQQVQFKVALQLPNVTIDDVVFPYLVNLQDQIASYLSIDETGKPVALKDYFAVHFRSAGSAEPVGKNDATIRFPQRLRVGLDTTFDEDEEPLSQEENADPTGTADISDTTSLVSVSTTVPVLKLTITSKRGLDILNEAIEVFRRILAFYLSSASTVYQLNLKYIPELKELKAIESTMLEERNKRSPAGTIAGMSAMRRVDILRRTFPSIFQKSYGTICQAPQQPTFINANEVKEYEAKQQVMAYPPHNPVGYFICDSAMYKFPGVKENKRMDNKEQYPYVPCCYKEDQMSPMANSSYNIYIGRKAKIDRERKDQKHRTNILEPHLQRSDLSVKLARFFEGGSRVTTRGGASLELTRNMSRVGAPLEPISASSIIHSILFAIGDPGYVQLEQKRLECENYVIDIRTRLAREVKAEVYKQELYDMDSKSIEALVRDANVFLDPRLFYRGLEEFFNINIYTFTPPVTSNENGSMEIARFKLFTARPINLNRGTVLILKNWGTKSDNRPYPQCELIIDALNGYEPKESVFGPEMTAHCHSSYLRLATSMSWILTPSVSSPEQKTPRVSAERSLVRYINLYSQSDFDQLFRSTAVYQYIDSYGKQRALILKLKRGSTEGYMTIIVPPAAPNNLPLFPDPQRMPEPPGRTVMEFFTFSAPTACVRTKLEDKIMITGLWYSATGLANFILVPISPTAPEEYSSLPDGPLNPIKSLKEDYEVKRLTKMKHDVDIIVQLLKYLYELERGLYDFGPFSGATLGRAVDRFSDLPALIMQDTKRFSPENFMNKYTRVIASVTPITINAQGLKEGKELKDSKESKSTPVAMNSPRLSEIDSARYYELSKIPYKLPEVDEPLMAIDILGDSAPTLFSDSKINLYSATFADRIYDMLRVYHKETLGMEPRPEAYLQHQYTVNITPANTLIFSRETDFNNWYNLTNKQHIDVRSVRRTLDSSLSTVTEPFLFEDTNGKLFLVQNMSNTGTGTRTNSLRAQRVTQYWLQYKVNLGSSPEPLPAAIPHVIYTIDNSNNSVVISTDNTGGQANYVSILYYGVGDQYAAMLDLP